MARGIIVSLLILISIFLIFEISARNLSAQDSGGLGDVLENQELILEKLGAMEKKLDEIDKKIGVARKDRD